MMNRVFIYVLLFIALALQACKEGCTNPNALNYDSSAQSDDGGCMYCDTAWYMVNNNGIPNVYEDDPTSPYYNYAIVNGMVQSYILDKNGNACNNMQNNTCTAFVHSVTFQNFISAQVVLSADLTLYYFTSTGTQGSTYHIDQLTIPVNSSITLDRVLPVCFDVTSSSFNVYMSNVEIQYQ